MWTPLKGPRTLHAARCLSRDACGWQSETGGLKAAPYGYRHAAHLVLSDEVGIPSGRSGQLALHLLQLLLRGVQQLFLPCRALLLQLHTHSML